MALSMSRGYRPMDGEPTGGDVCPALANRMARESSWRRGDIHLASLTNMVQTRVSSAYQEYEGQRMRAQRVEDEPLP